MCNNTQKKKAAGAGKDFTLFFGVMLHFNFKCVGFYLVECSLAQLSVLLQFQLLPPIRCLRIVQRQFLSQVATRGICDPFWYIRCLIHHDEIRYNVNSWCVYASVIKMSRTFINEI